MSLKAPLPAWEAFDAPKTWSRVELFDWAQVPIANRPADEVIGNQFEGDDLGVLVTQSLARHPDIGHASPSDLAHELTATDDDPRFGTLGQLEI